MLLDMPKYMSTVMALNMYSDMPDNMSKVFDFDMAFDMSLDTVCFTGKKPIFLFEWKLFPKISYFFY
jgi:hypothetical protein